MVFRLLRLFRYTRSLGFSLGVIGLAGAQSPAPTYLFTHFAGSIGGAGYADGTSLAAKFNTPSSTAVDITGNIYVADFANHTIRKISPDGMVTTLAGRAGQAGSADGIGSDARFNSPSGVATDASGNVYVADTNNETIRKITPTGIVTTFAGNSGQVGSVDGSGISAEFNHPAGLTVDSAGILYVADENNHIIRKITSSGVVTTLAGTAGVAGFADGTGAAAQFNQPPFVATDGVGNVYVTDSRNGTVRKITPSGVVTTFAGVPGLVNLNDPMSHPSSPLPVGQFASPSGIAVDQAGNVYVSDFLTTRISKISPGGVASDFAGDVGAGPVPPFDFAEGLAVDHSGNLYLADSGNSLIREISPEGVITTLAGVEVQRGSTDGAGAMARFDGPNGLALDASGNIYLADVNNQLIRKITPTGVVTTLAGMAGVAGNTDGQGAAARFNQPAEIAVDAAGEVYVLDAQNTAIRKIDAEGTVTTLPISSGPGGSFPTIAALAADPAGNLYATDAVESTILKISSSNEVTTLAGTAGQTGSADGTGAAAQFNGPGAMCVDSAGNIFVADGGGALIRKITPDGMVTTVAGSAGQFAIVDGTKSSAQFAHISGICVDPTGTLYLTDTNTIRQVTLAGVVTTLGGKRGPGGSSDGIGLAASFSAPMGIGVDRTGDLYIADFANEALIKATPVSLATRLSNLSTRSLAGTGNNTQIAGFVVGGTQAKQILIRASGPTLATLVPQLTGVIPDPALTVFSGPNVIGANAGWGNASNATEIKSAATRVGAFAWPDGSKDSALLMNLSPGPYTVEVTGQSGETGIDLVEVYDADLVATNRLINLSTRSSVGTGNGIQIAGFVIDGPMPKKVLIRASGPSLAQVATSLTGLLPDPTLTLFNGQSVIGSNTIWGTATNAAEIQTTAVRVGAFDWTSGSKDSAILITLQPGVYTAEVSGASGDTGVALVEVYDAD